MARKTLQLESWVLTFSFVPPRTLGSEFTSFTAKSMAIFATLPMVEFKVKIAPIFTTAGLGERVPPIPFEKITP